MLVRAEKILSHDGIFMDKSEEEIFNIVREELAKKIIDECIDKGLMQIEVANEINNCTFGSVVKVRASLRAYNPDD